MSTDASTTASRAGVKRPKPPLIDAVIAFLSSVRFGVTLLCILVVLSMIGMLIIQQNVQGFDAYYATRTPAEKLVYGYLGFFDIYHSWYYNFLLLVLSLNIILASIDRFPAAWSYIRKPKVTATKPWLARQIASCESEVAIELADAANRISDLFKSKGLKVITTLSADGTKTIFGERGKSNRLGAYLVHVALLTLFLGHFVALQTGFDADVSMTPGQVTNQIQLIQINLDKTEKFAVTLPFSITCTDIQQKLINPNGNIDVTNTLDWRTQIQIDDPEYGVTVADISLNKPFTYRGYRFFQAQTIPVGHARVMTVDAFPESGGDPIRFQIPRNGRISLSDGTLVEYDSFQADFTLSGGQPDTKSADYNNPAAVFNVTNPSSEPIKVYAFANKLPDNAPINAPRAGYRWKLVGFEKAPSAHILSIKFDPYDGSFIAWYFGGAGLMLALGFVFLFSHKRIWALVEANPEGTVTITMAGDSNRNHLGFKDFFNIISSEVEKQCRKRNPTA